MIHNVKCKPFSRGRKPWKDKLDSEIKCLFPKIKKKKSTQFIHCGKESVHLLVLSVCRLWGFFKFWFLFLSFIH